MERAAAAMHRLVNDLYGKQQQLEARADQLTGTEIPALNTRLWELGIGAIWK